MLHQPARTDDDAREMAASDKPRLGVILEYCAGWLRPQENHVLGVPKEIVRVIKD
jgi:hypothetical protein